MQVNTRTQLTISGASEHEQLINEDKGLLDLMLPHEVNADIDKNYSNDFSLHPLLTRVSTVSLVNKASKNNQK